ncbi:acyl-CoA thioesterase [Desulfocurvibacter africanus]|uniref:acyl-CoA thioesterase n=1 Tax=Desulfocurvibacter africanus TaxID=873 RepID=UPI002FDA92B8
MSRKAYFRNEPGTPAPLRINVQRRVRFEEVDVMGIVWHGRYPSFCEDARVALGDRYGIGYLDFHGQGILTPIKQMHIDYQRPLRFKEEFSIEALLHWTEAARINYEFILRNAEGVVTTTGYSVQLMLDKDLDLLIAPPPFYQDFCARWKAGELA